MNRNDLITIAQRLREYVGNTHHVDPISDAFKMLIGEASEALSKAAQPQGEPVAWSTIEAAIWGAFADGSKDYKGCTRERLRELQALYAEQPAPVYQTRWNRLGEWEEWKTVSQDQYQRSESRLFERRIVYAEQPAPVAVVLPERLPGDDGVCTESHYAKGRNDCLDEVTLLNKPKGD